MSTLRFRMGMVKEENASLCGKIRTMEAIKTVTRSQERRTRREMERLSYTTITNHLTILSSDDYTTDNDSPDTPPSPTYSTPFTEITSSTQRSHVIPRRRVMILAPGQPIPHGRPYRYHLNGPIHMMTARKRVGPLPTHLLDVRHSADHSSLDSSSEASSDFHSDASSDSSSRHSLSDHSSPDLSSNSAGPSRKRRRSPMTYVPALPLVYEALSPVRADLIPSPKRVRDSGYSADVEVDPRETSLRDDVIVRGNEEPHLEQDIDPEIQAEIDECFAYADAFRDKGIAARVVLEAVDREESETGARGPVEVRVERVTHPVMPEDILEPAQEGANEVTYETLGDLVQRIVGVESADIALTERIAELERDNKRLRGTASVESQRVDRLQRDMSRMQRELRQIQRLRFYDRVRVGRLEACARKKMPNTRSGASMTHEEVEELVTRRVAEEMEARKAARTLEPLNENGDEQEGENGGNGNGGNGGNGNGGNGENRNGNRNGNHGGTNPDSNIVMGTFLLNNCYATMLFDSGADRSFVSSTFSALLDVAPSTLDTSYAVELADGRISKTNIILRGCTLGLLGHPFDIDLMPIELGSFDVIIGMDWLAKYHALIVCDEKVVRIPYGDEVLIIRGDNCDSGSKLNIISCTRTQKYIEKGCQVYLAQVTSKKAGDKWVGEKRLEDCSSFKEISRSFLVDLPRLLPD
ncbi:putative reverse transcriptase domain-containing protein [Tanacetum coccineum]